MSGVVSAFDRAAGGYDDWYRTGKGGQVLSAEVAVIGRLIPVEGVGVEIGAGTGVFAEALTTSMRRIVCLDLSREMLLRAESRGLDCVLGSAEKTPMRQGVFGFAYMVTVMEFLPHPAEALEEASEVTWEDAPVVPLFINRDSPWGELYGEMASKGDPIFSHAKLYTLSEIESLSRGAGLAPAEELGTLTTAPLSPEAGDEITQPSGSTGVIAVKLVKGRA